MTTLETVIQVAFVIINSIAFCTVCIIISKWLRRIEDKTDELKEAVYTDIARGSFFILSGGAFHRHDSCGRITIKLPGTVYWNGTVILMRIPVHIPNNFNYNQYV